MELVLVLVPQTHLFVVPNLGIRVPMLALALVAQFAYLPFDNQLFWTALFGWYAVCGAGPISVDGLLRRGLADSALPVIPRIVNFTESLRNRCGPTYLSAVRVWLGAALLLAALRPHAADPQAGPKHVQK